MKQEETIHKMATHISQIHVNAASDKVFEALTNPDLIRRWQFGRVLFTDWKAGSEIRFQSETESKTLRQWGTVLEVKTNELIRYNLFTPAPGLEDRPENYCVTSYVLTDKNGQTNIKIIQEDQRPEGFIPVSLEPVLLLLKQIVEVTEI